MTNSITEKCCLHCWNANGYLTNGNEVYRHRNLASCLLCCYDFSQSELDSSLRNCNCCTNFEYFMDLLQQMYSFTQVKLIVHKLIDKLNVESNFIFNYRKFSLVCWKSRFEKTAMHPFSLLVLVMSRIIQIVV